VLLVEPGCWAPALPCHLTPSAPVCAGGEEGLEGTKIHELSPLLVGAVRTLKTSVLEGTGMCTLLTQAVLERGSPGSAALSCSDAELCKARAERFEVKGCFCSQLEGRGCLSSRLSPAGFSSVPRGKETLGVQGEKGLVRVYPWGV